MSGKFVFIGAINLKGKPSCGETIKNHEVVRFLQKSNYDIVILDTYNWKKKPLLLFTILYYSVFSKRHIVISASTISVLYLTKLLYFFSKNKSKTYFVIGNTLPSLLENSIKLTKFYHAYDYIYIEGLSSRNRLHNLGLNTAEYLPNFKSVNDIQLQLNKDSKRDSPEVNFVFLSRILPEKGVDLIFEAVKRLNHSIDAHFSVTLYGPIEETYKNKLYTRLLDFNNIKYGGFLDLTSIDGYKQLQSFDVFLFPTYWYGEGFPGVLIDSFIVGLPVIASDWNLNKEIIIHNDNGLIIKCKDVDALYNSMDQFISEKEILVRMSERAFSSALLFDTDLLLTTIFEKYR